ncbi:MAG: holo-ACP synthase [Candidatus Sungbacteria bacterium]|uniref:Holo-ACP synthase n=1 Tax=Candidatus Sungiibacteriota bacterium TaxID=2750080 RepID=A0A9D6LT39_9BACT|nr:holo-ACP synthase [Candidatus Sungbacteria bacterium]
MGKEWTTKLYEGIGVDLVELAAIRRARFPWRVAEYFLTPREYKEAQNSSDLYQFIASRFAAKEAVIKAFPADLSPKDFEIIKGGRKPEVRFIHKQHAGFRAFVSLSHSEHYVIGFAKVTS